MARLFILLFASFISFSSYSETINKGSVYKYFNELPQNYVYFREISEAPSFSWGRHSSCAEGSQFVLGEDLHVRCGTYWRPVGSYKGQSTHCPTSHPIDNGDGTCSNNETPEPDPHSCPDSGTFFKRLTGGKSINGYSTCIPENCVVGIQAPVPQVCIALGGGTDYRCPWDVFYTGQACKYNPDAPGLNPPDHEYPDVPVDKPDPDLPDIPELPDGGGEGGGVEPPIYDPDAKPEPEDPVEKPNPDPTPDPDDPNLSHGENAIVGELSEANQRLENIDHVLEDLTNTTKLDNDALHAYQASLLGEMQTMNKTLEDGIGGGGGGGISEGLGEIACLLDETCEGGGSKSSVTENQCKAFECDGDAVVCYIARKEWAKNCEVEDFLADGGAGDDFSNGLQSLIDENPIEDLEAGSVNIDSLMNKYTNGNGLQLREGCPAPNNVNLGIASMTIDYQPFCDLAVIINWFLISFALISSGLLIAKYGL
ncbi:TPA: hypothetical protein P0E23_001069 [Vibrio harveyi]|nr:hypothetical protein [Vibrio harveyi]